MKIEITEDTIKAHAKVLSQAAVTTALIWLAHWGAVQCGDVPKGLEALHTFWGCFVAAGVIFSGIGTIITLATLGEELGWWGPGKHTNSSGPR